MEKENKGGMMNKERLVWLLNAIILIPDSTPENDKKWRNAWNEILDGFDDLTGQINDLNWTLDEERYGDDI